MIYTIYSLLSTIKRLNKRYIERRYFMNVFLVLQSEIFQRKLYYEVEIPECKSYSEDYILYKINKAIEQKTIKTVEDLIEYIHITFGATSKVSCINKKVLEQKIA